MTKDLVDYKKLRTELDEVLASLDDGSLDVDVMTAKFQRGMEIVQLLESYLKISENKIIKIKRTIELK